MSDGEAVNAAREGYLSQPDLPTTRENYAKIVPLPPLDLLDVTIIEVALQQFVTRRPGAEAMVGDTADRVMKAMLEFIATVED